MDEAQDQLAADLGKKASSDVLAALDSSLKLAETHKQRFVICNFAFAASVGMCAASGEASGFTKDALKGVLANLLDRYLDGAFETSAALKAATPLNAGKETQ